MRKLRNLPTTLAVAATFLATAPASGQYAAYPDGREPAYTLTFYSDSTYTTVVGTMTPSCGWSAVLYSLEGQTSYFYVSEPAGYCPE